MRITNSMIFEQNIVQLNTLQSSLAVTQQEVSSSKKDLTGQNATLASQVINIQQMQDINTQYTNNRVSARTSLQLVDGSLQNAANVLTSLQTLVVKAQNGTLGPSDRSAIGGQVQADLTQLQTIANSTDGAGNYIFSGYKSGTLPYVPQTPANAAGNITYNYNGDQGQTSIEVSEGQLMPTSVSGSSVFGPSGSTNIFSQLSALVTTLNSPIAGYQSPNLTAAQNAAMTSAQQTAQYAQDLTTASAAISQTLTNVTNANVHVGDNEQQLNSLDTLGANLTISYQEMMSTTGGVNEVEAITALNQQNLALMAAEKSFAQVSNLSLFNYIH